MTSAPFATPEKLLPCPAAMPATWVPCLQPDAAYVQLTPEPGPVWAVEPFAQVELAE